MRYDHIGAYGDRGMVTPALDRLVEHGVNFHNCFTQNPMCMPSRCSFMTGLYPQQTGVTHNGYCLPPDFEPTVATAFKAGGYLTGQIGKLHFQPHDNLDYSVAPRHTYGFDVFWPSEERGNYSDPYYHWLEGKYPQYASLFRCPRSSDDSRNSTEKAPRPLDAPWQASQAGWIVETARDFLKTRRNDDVLLHLGFYNPHPPLLPVREAWDCYSNRAPAPPRRYPQEWQDKPAPLANMLQHRSDWLDADFLAYRKGLAAMVTECDLAIGWLVEQLRINQMLDDTLLVFSSDHGDFAGDHSITHKSSACYDEVMRVPLVLHWPNGLGTKRRDVDGLIEMVDLLPTLLGLSGSHIPKVMEGVSYADSLLDGQEIAGRDDVFAYHGDGQAMLRTRSHKLIRYLHRDAEVLYDFSDPDHERINRAADAACTDTLDEMRDRLLTRMLSAGRSRLSRYHPY
jgi:arylsulfatase A-like enzyme